MLERETLDMVCSVLGEKVTKILEPYEDEKYVYKNTAQSSSEVDPIHWTPFPLCN